MSLEDQLTMQSNRWHRLQPFLQVLLLAGTWAEAHNSAEEGIAVAAETLAVGRPVRDIVAEGILKVSEKCVRQGIDASRMTRQPALLTLRRVA